MKKLKSILTICMSLIVIFCFSGCTTSMAPSKVYDEILTYAKESNTIFTVDTQDNISINISYASQIDTVLENEAKYYKSNGVPDTEFYTLKTLYEPILSFSLNFLLSNKEILNMNKEVNKISDEQAGKIFDSFYELRKKIEIFIDSRDMLNYYKDRFVNDLYKSKTDPTAFNQLDILKVKYGNMIAECFNLNNTFIDVYESVIPVKDYRLETEQSFSGLDLQDLLYKSLAKVAEIAFYVDGTICSFTDTTKTRVELVLEGANNHSYSPHVSSLIPLIDKISTITQATFQGLDNNNTMKDLAKILQSKMQTLNNLNTKFINTINKINYKKYVESKQSLLDYISNLSKEEQSNFIFVEGFLNDVFTPVVSTLTYIFSLL